MLITAQQMLVMLLLILVGYGLFKWKIINAEGTRQLANILTMAIIPATLIHSLQQPFHAEHLPGLGFTALITVLTLAASVGLGYVGLSKNPSKGVEITAITFTNAGFIGIPLVTAVLGTGGMPYLSMYMMLCTIFLFTLGRYLMSGGDKNSVKLQNIIKSPGVIAPIIGFAFYFANFTLPAILGTVVKFVAGINTPVAMFVLGSYLAQQDLSKLARNVRAYYVTFLRLIVSTVISMLILWLFPVARQNNILALTLAVAFACPPAVAVSFLSQQFGGDYEYGAGLVVMGTMASVLSIPVIMLLAQFLFPA